MPDQNENFLKQLPASIKEGAEIRYTSDMSVFRPHCYATGTNIEIMDYHICLPTSTPPPLIIDGTEYQYRKGRIIIFAPDTSAGIEKYYPTLPYIALNISKGFFTGITLELPGRTQKSFSYINNPYSRHLISLICNFESELNQYREACPLMLQSLCTQIVVQILRESGLNTFNDEKKPTTDKNYMDRAIEYMQNFYNANIRIEDICRQIHLSPYYFIRMFKEKTGMTPHEYLLDIRMKKAAELLKKGDYSIDEVSGLIGFVSMAHFSNTFRKVMGIAPSVYRKVYYSTAEKSH